MLMPALEVVVETSLQFGMALMAVASIRLTCLQVGMALMVVALACFEVGMAMKVVSPVRWM